MRGEADRVDDAWQLRDDSVALSDGIEDDEALELALLAYAQRSAARTGAQWYAAEFARRDEEEDRQRELTARWRPATVAPGPSAPSNAGLIDASVEDNVVGGTPTGLGIAAPTPVPAMRHPHVPRPPAEEPSLEPKRRRRRKDVTEERTSSPALSAPAWAQMSPGARRLYGLTDPPGANGAG